ncbi:MAG: DUF2034 domain-containing protein [Burkholderiales bacterium]|nr:DUF2034 domain-containing protein [Burkholderiales bacterium]
MDLTVIAARLPWWVGVLLALLSYVGMHSLAGMAITPPKGFQGLGSSIVQNVAKTFGMFAQFVLPVLFLIGAGISAFRRPKRGAPSSGAAGSFDAYLQGNNKKGEKDPGAEQQSDKHEDRIYPLWKSASTDAKPPAAVDVTRWNAGLIAALEWKRFEEICAGLFERLGFAPKLAACGADGGIDIHLYWPPSDRLVAIVQCKAWAKKVGVNVIRELRGVMASEPAPKGIFVTSSTFSDDAIAFAKANKIALMDGAELLKSILKLPEEKQTSLLHLATAGDYTTPTCASCGIKLIARKPKLGGKAFWGCVNYPRCKMKLNVAGA